MDWTGLRWVGIDSIGLVGGDGRISRQLAVALGCSDQSPFCGASVQCRSPRSVGEADETRTVQAGGKRYQGAGAKRRRSGTGSKLKTEWVGVCSTLLSAGVTLAPPGRGQYWGQAGLVWRVWVEVKSRSRSSSWCSSSKLCPPGQSCTVSPTCVMGRLADWQIAD